jgi:DNA-binding LacI/PurR family transcriptional regulator
MHAKHEFDLGSLGIPIVACGRPVTGIDRVSYVDAGNVEGARKAVAHLIATGRKAIATIAGPPDMSAGVDRLLGYREAMVARGPADQGLIAYGDFGPVSGEHALCRLIDHRPQLDAVFAASDLMALGAVRTLRRLGRRIPDDVAVFGFDDAPFAAHTEPSLSTIRQPVDAMADRMVSELMTRIVTGDADPAHIVLDTQPVLRDSA